LAQGWIPAVLEIQLRRNKSRFYQRLLAMDPQEARSLVDDFLKERTLTELYDQIVIPALSMAEEDRHKGALDATRENFVMDNITELIVEIAEHSPELNVSDDVAPSIFAGEPPACCVWPLPIGRTSRRRRKHALP
jgi:hypothetical protein